MALPALATCHTRSEKKLETTLAELVRKSSGRANARHRYYYIRLMEWIASLFIGPCGMVSISFRLLAICKLKAKDALREGPTILPIGNHRLPNSAWPRACEAVTRMHSAHQSPTLD